MKQDSAGALDVIIEELGIWSKYNMLMYSFIFIPIFFTGMYGAAYVFIAGDIPYRCEISQCEQTEDSNWMSWAIPSNGNISDKCSQYSYIDNNSTKCTADSFDRNKTIQCDRFVYYEENTIVKEFNLGCQEWKRTLIGSLHSGGHFISISATGILSDRFGRKICLIIAALICGVVGVIRSFSINYTMFAVLEFLESSLGGGLYSCAFILLMEIVSPKYRMTTNALLSIVYTIGSTIPAVLLWAIPDWKINLRLMYTPAFITIAFVWILDESARWLLVKDKYDDAIKILKKAARINKIILSDAHLAQLQKKKKTDNLPMEKELSTNNGASKRAKPILLQILSSRILISRVLLCSFIWITCTFIYIGMSVHSTSLSGNKYINFILVCLIEIPAHITAMFVVDRIGRRLTLNITLIFAGVCCIAQAYIPSELYVVSLLIYMSGKCSITLAYGCFYVYATEVFPTNLRQSLLGFCSTIGRFGSVVAPQVPLMAMYMNSLPSLLFGGMALAAGCLSLIMPETTNRKLPDTIEEAEEISSKKM